MKLLSRVMATASSGRSPSGERGLKFDTPITRDSVTRRSPSGERGLKYGDDDSEEHADDRRSPSGERGLKCVDPVRAVLRSLSLPIRGAWIEIRFKRGKIIRDGRSPSGERGLKYPRTPRAYRKTQSRSPSGERGLKSHGRARPTALAQVAPHPGSVD